MKLLNVITISLLLSGCSMTTTYQGSEYQYVAKNVTWHEAKLLAEKAGGQLAVFETQDESTYVQSSLPKKTIAWVGLTDEKKEGQWLWINGQLLATDMHSLLQQGGDLEGRDYGYVLLQGGFGARHSTGVLPRGWKGRSRIDGFIIEFENQSN